MKLLLYLRTFFWAAAPLFFGGTLHGQSPVTETVAERFAAGELVRFDFRVYPQFPADIPDRAFFFTLEDGEVKRVEPAFSATQPSPRYRYRGPSPLRFYAEDESGAIRRIAESPVDGAPPPSILVFLSKAEGDGYLLRRLAEEPAGFDAGSIRFVNLTQKTIFGQIGRERVQVDSGNEEIFQVRGGAEALDVRVQLARFDAGDPKLIYSSVWPVDRQRRSTVFLLPSRNPGRGEVTFRSFAEVPPEPDPEEEGKE